LTQGRRLKVLIVDDEEDLVEMLAMRLEASGDFEITSRHDGASGLEAAKAGGFDAVLLDGKMPLMTGWEVCVKLREAGSPAPIVVMTAVAPAEAQKRARECGADALILKPYDQARVAAVLKDACRAKI
jgi:DNA-binding response OmpR family regulator